MSSLPDAETLPFSDVELHVRLATYTLHLDLTRFKPPPMTRLPEIFGWNLGINCILHYTRTEHIVYKAQYHKCIH
jgi:hypothetical protein